MRKATAILTMMIAVMLISCSDSGTNPQEKNLNGIWTIHYSSVGKYYDVEIKIISDTTLNMWGYVYTGTYENKQRKFSGSRLVGYYKVDLVKLEMTSDNLMDVIYTNEYSELVTTKGRRK